MSIHASSIAEVARQVRDELIPYYRDTDPEPSRARVEDVIRARMDAEAEAHPAWTAMQCKARLHEIMAELADPVIFHSTPFAFECGVRPALSWGMYGAGAWLRDRRVGLFDHDGALAGQQAYHDSGITVLYHPVDFDHCNLGYDLLLARGISGLQEDARAARLTLTADPVAVDFLDGVLRSLQAMTALTARFAEGYAAAAISAVDAEQAALLQRTALALRHVPSHPPRTFFEALLTLSAWRELGASLEGMGISVLGHLDRLLYPYYAADLDAGRLTQDEATALLTRYLLHTDCRMVDLHRLTWAETSTTMNLGGCDADGVPVNNTLTFLLLRLHRELGLINPKPNCRINHASDEAYLRELAAHVASGCNTAAFYNDEVLIPAQQHVGKRIEDCRLYVNGGCQEPMLPGFEHSAGAHWYLNLPRSLELTLHSAQLAAYPALPLTPVTVPASFDALYTRVIENIRALVADQGARKRASGQVWPEVNPCPLISVTLADCLARGRDLTAGGGRYNPTGVCFVGFATLVDSLFAIKEAVFARSLCSYEALLSALARDFAGDEELLAALLRLPHYGQDHAEVDTFAARVAHDLALACQGVENERGGPHQPALFSYYQFDWMSAPVGATPDGRHRGDPLSQGAGPSRLARVPSIAHFLHSIARIDFTDFPASAVLDLQLPLSTNPASMTDSYLALLKTFRVLGGPVLQMSVVDPDTLRRAQQHPDDYRDLVVRVCGYSAYFVALDRCVQDEILTRTLVE